jgi:hypothetical protein
MKVSDFVVERLHAWGVRRIYGYPGDGINGVVGAVQRGGNIEFIQVRHEEMAAFMAVAPVGILEVEQKRRARRRETTAYSRCPIARRLKPICRTFDAYRRGRDELEQFFSATDALEDKELKFLGWRGPNHAIKTIKRLSQK